MCEARVLRLVEIKSIISEITQEGIFKKLKFRILNKSKWMGFVCANF